MHLQTPLLPTQLQQDGSGVVLRLSRLPCCLREIAASWKAELDIAGLSAALTRDLQPHWQAANSRVAEGLQLA